jgi:type III restriction enzyme
MELKNFQKLVIGDLKDYLALLNQTKRADLAYNEFWNRRGIKIGLDNMPPYKNSIKNVPHVCFKVPTGGGKTFIACNSIKPIFDAMPFTKTKAVAWLVPSTTILEQTVKNLQNVQHEYRQKINVDFNNQVAIYTKDELLNAEDFNPTVVNERLSIFILSYDTLRSRKKEDRKIYQENGNLRPFVEQFPSSDTLIDGVDETALIQVINQLNPVVIVDESHNAETELSIEMLKNLNPAFILDLTATPRNNSNIISCVDSLQLKKENMVKLPVVVYNHHKIEDVILDSIVLRNNLEAKALEEEKITNKYIRPIVLFQAQPKINENSESYNKLKEKLLHYGIPKEQIAIKTSTINEIKGTDLASKDCPIRYIITVNALKEGWDCPNAYILSTLANRSSKVDVEQILGRILRQPYTTKHTEPLLNISYVFTCSDDFRNTLDNIVKGLNRAGYSKKDFRVGEESNKDISKSDAPEFKQQIIELSDRNKTNVQEHDNEIEYESEEFLEFNTDSIKDKFEERKIVASEIIETAVKSEKEYTEEIIAIESENLLDSVAEELKGKMNIFKIKDIYRNDLKNIKIPQFFLKIPENVFHMSEVKLAKENLADDFTLKDKDTMISFESVDPEIYKIDLEEQSKNEYVPKYLKMTKSDIKYINEYISKLPGEEKLKSFKNIVYKSLGRIDTISDKEIKDYIEKVLKNLSKEQLYDLENSPYKYSSAIKKKILDLQETFMEREFERLIDTGKIFCMDSYSFSQEISPLKFTSGIAKSLYEAEEEINDFEYKVITEIASLENVKVWHRNIKWKDFCINGFIYHYPDFIVITKANTIVMVETKGDFLSVDESLKRLRLGRKWQELSGRKYKYFMVFENKRINESGAYNLDEFISIMKEIE